MNASSVIAIPVVLVSLAANAYFIWAGRVVPVCTSADTTGPVVVHVKGGLLEVSTIIAPEKFEKNTPETIFGIHVGTTISHIGVRAVYRYHVKLDDDWKVLLKDKTFVVISPAVTPSLPVAIDTGTLYSETSGRWSIFTGSNRIGELQKSITKTLAFKAATPSYINFQREVARQTLQEFVAKWLVKQEEWKEASAYPIKVFFADEPIQTLSAVPQPFAGSL